MQDGTPLRDNKSCECIEMSHESIDTEWQLHLEGMIFDMTKDGLTNSEIGYILATALTRVLNQQMCIEDDR